MPSGQRRLWCRDFRGPSSVPIAASCSQTRRNASIARASTTAAISTPYQVSSSGSGAHCTSSRNSTAAEPHSTAGLPRKTGEMNRRTARAGLARAGQRGGEQDQHADSNRVPADVAEQVADDRPDSGGDAAVLPLLAEVVNQVLAGQPADDDVEQADDHHGNADVAQRHAPPALRQATAAAKRATTSRNSNTLATSMTRDGVLRCLELVGLGDDDLSCIGRDAIDHGIRDAELRGDVANELPQIQRDGAAGRRHRLGPGLVAQDRHEGLVAAPAGPLPDRPHLIGGEQAIHRGGRRLPQRGGDRRSEALEVIR